MNRLFEHFEGFDRSKRRRIEDCFHEYSAGYDTSDPKIKLKIDHTYRVAGLCDRIAGSIGADRDFAWLCGMLHDVGRFEQIRRYNTFVDAASVDHAQFGADLLFKEGLIERFEIEPEEQWLGLLERVIRNHSLYRLEPGLSEEEQKYCNILRDADKVDIFRVNCDTPPEEIYNVTTEQLVNSSVSEEVKECFRGRTAVLRSLKKYPADFIVGHICLVFELVYPISAEIAREQGYLDRMLGFRSENEETQEWFRYVRENVWCDGIIRR